MANPLLSCCRTNPRPFWATTALLLLGLTVLWKSLSSPFIPLDDPDYVTENPVVRQGLTAPGLKWAFTTMHASNWHPLTWVSHMADCHLYGLQPFGHHLTNLLLHLASSVLLLHVLHLMTGALWRSALVAGIFLLHPLHIESVAWVAERKDVLSGLFFMLGLLAYARFVHTRRRAHYFGLLLCFAAGLLSKPMLVTFPFVLLLLDYWPLHRWPTDSPRNNPDRAATCPSRLLLEKLPLFALAAVSCILTFLAQQRGGAVSTLESINVSGRLANAVAAYSAYVQKAFWPTRLSIFYPYSEPASARILAGLFLLGLVSALAILLRKRLPALLTGWFWFLGMLVPVIGLVQVGEQSMADRYTYLPLIGLAVAVIWIIAELARRYHLPATACALAAGLLIGGLSFANLNYLAVWTSSESLFSHALAVTQSNHVAYSSLATTLLEAGKPEEAAPCYSQAVAIKPGYLPAVFGLAKVFETRREFPQAERLLRRAAQKNPQSGPVHYNLAVVLAQQGKTPEAREHYFQVLQADPSHGRAHNNLSSLLLAEGRVREAVQHGAQAVKLLPDSPEAHYNLGNALFLSGELAQAAAHYRQSLHADRTQAETRVNLAKALIKMGALPEAELELHTLLRAHPTHVEAHQLLVSICLAAGREIEARKEYERALAAAPQTPELMNNFAWLLATARNPRVRNGTEAVRLAEHACKLVPASNASFLSTLAAAYAEAGQFPAAITTQERARQQALLEGNASFTEKAEKRLLLFRAFKALAESGQP